MGADRWSDDKLETFYQEFREHIVEFHAHIGSEAYEQKQQQELYAAVFQVADEKKNVPPGLLQMVTQVSKQLHDLRVWQDRQRTFVGGMLFAVTSVWFVLTEAGHKILSLLGAVK